MFGEKDIWYQKLEYTVNEDGSYIFKCNVVTEVGETCGKAYKDHCTLIRHCYGYHNDPGRLICPLNVDKKCDPFFLTTQLLQDHMKTVHGGKIVQKFTLND